MGILIKHARKSNLNQMVIQVGEEVIKFNLYKELGVDEELINDELSDQPRIYGYLTLIYNRLNAYVKDLEIKVDKAEALALKKYTAKNNPATGRPFSKEYAKSKLFLDVKYLKLRKTLTLAEVNKEDIRACIEAFKQRKDLIQTIAANRRAESRG